MCIILFYEFFYISARFFPEKIFESVFLLTIIYVLVTMRIMSPWWYLSSLAFPCGVLFGKCKVKIDKVIQKSYKVCLSICICLFVICFLVLYILEDYSEVCSVFPHYVISITRLLLSMVHGVLFCSILILVLMVAVKIPPETNNLSKRLSSIYLEIYVMQGLAFNFLHNNIYNINDDFMFATLSIFFTIMFAVAIHPIFNKTIKLVKIQKKR